MATSPRNRSQAVLILNGLSGLNGQARTGKTELADATSTRVADSGNQVLVMSTDPAAKLTEMLAVARAHRSMPTRFADAPDAFPFEATSTGQMLRLLRIAHDGPGTLLAHSADGSRVASHSGVILHESQLDSALAALTNHSSADLVRTVRPGRVSLSSGERASTQWHDFHRDEIAEANRTVDAAHDAREGTGRIVATLHARRTSALPSGPSEVVHLAHPRVPQRPFIMVGVLVDFLGVLAAVVATTAGAGGP